MQHLVRHNNEPLVSFQEMRDRRNQLRVEILQVVPGRCQQRSGMLLQISGLQMELGKLKVQSPYAKLESLKTEARVRKTWNSLRPDDKRLEAIADGVVLHEDFIRLEHVLHIVNASEMACSEELPSRVFQIPQLEAIPQVPVRGEQFLPLSSCRMPQRVRSSPTSFRRLVENVELLTNLANAQKPGRLLANGIPGRLEVALHQIDQCSRLGSLDKIECAVQHPRYCELDVNDVLVNLYLSLPKDIRSSSSLMLPRNNSSSVIARMIECLPLLAVPPSISLSLPRVLNA